MRRFNYTNLRVYWDSSRHATRTSKVISNGIRAWKSKSTEQHDWKLFSHLDSGRNSMVKLSNSWAEVLTPQSNLMPQWAKNTVNDLSVVSLPGTKVAFYIKQVGFTFSSLLPETSKLKSAAGSLLRMEVILANTSLLLNTLSKKKMISWSRTWHLHSWNSKIAHTREQPNTQNSCLPRESSLNHLWPSWKLPQVIRHISPCLSCPWFLAERDYCSKSINISIAFIGSPECPRIKNTIDWACLQSYVRQVLHSSRYYKELAAASLGLTSKNNLFFLAPRLRKVCSMWSQCMPGRVFTHRTQENMAVDTRHLLEV